VKSGIAPAASELIFDPEALLVREPRVLLDPRFLGALHLELEDELGCEPANTTLLQIGFLHGLRDALHAIGKLSQADEDSALASLPSPLPTRMRAAPGAQPPGAIELHGSWPERCEASARLASIGRSPRCACAVSAGYTSGWLSGLFDADIAVLETSCGATGAAECRFVAREAEAWRAHPDGEADALLAALPFVALREAIRNEPAPAPEPKEPARGFDGEAAVIHIWGPVMVIPFCGPDEALQALDLIGRDPSARQVSVVVLDLSGAIVDEAFGAVALEQLIEGVEAIGAEIVFAGVGELSANVVEGLSTPPLLIVKDLHTAIATAFQVASAQRRLV
jgi:anti-anti-sigma regulatory factor